MRSSSLAVVLLLVIGSHGMFIDTATAPPVDQQSTPAPTEASPQHKDQPTTTSEPQPQDPSTQQPEVTQPPQQPQQPQTQAGTRPPETASTATAPKEVVVQQQQLHPITNSNIHHAVKEWMKDRNSALSKFGHISTWDTSRVTDMSYLFSWERSHALSQFNDNITTWDTHRVVNMSHMFYGNAVMNLDLGKWNTTHVQDFSSCFAHAQAFEGHGLRHWNTRHAIDMRRMFRDAKVFIGNGIHVWDTRSLSNATRMFHGATNFHGAHHWQWNTHRLLDMTEMFAETPVFTGDLSALDVSSVTSMKGAFFKAAKFNGDLTLWNTHRVVDMNSMFAYATAFQGTGLDHWNVSRVTNFANTFKRSNFNQNVSGWDVKRATDLRSMFRYAAHMKQKVCWKLHKHANVDGIFFQAKAHFDRTCVKHKDIVASCCLPRLDNACQCGEMTVNQDHEVQTMNNATTAVAEEPGSVGAASSVSFFSSGSDHLMALGIASVVGSLIMLFCVIRRFRLRNSITTIEFEGDDPDVSDLDMTPTPYNKNATLTIPATSTKSFSSHESDDEGPMEEVTMREII